MSEIRTPPSLKWLLKKRAYLMGDIQRLEENLAKNISLAQENVKALESKLASAKESLKYQSKDVPLYVQTLKKELVAIDTALAMHEIQVDINLINPVAPHQGARIGRYGEVTRHVYNCLKSAAGKPVSTLQMAVYCAAHCAPNLSDEEFIVFRKKIRLRLKDMVREGRIARVPTPASHEGKWALLPSTPGSKRSTWSSKAVPLGD